MTKANSPLIVTTMQSSVFFIRSFSLRFLISHIITLLLLLIMWAYVCNFFFALKAFSLIILLAYTGWKRNLALTLHTQRQNTRSGTKDKPKTTRSPSALTDTNRTWPQSTNTIFYFVLYLRGGWRYSHSHQKLVTLWNMLKLKHTKLFRSINLFYSMF